MSACMGIWMGCGQILFQFGKGWNEREFEGSEIPGWIRVRQGEAIRQQNPGRWIRVRQVGGWA